MNNLDPPKFSNPGKQDAASVQQSSISI